MTRAPQQRAILLALGLMIALSACVSTPNYRYYTLDVRTSASNESSVNLRIERIDIYDALDRSEIMIQASPTRVEYYALDRWAASVSEIVRTKLETEFTSIRPDRETIWIRVRVLALEQMDRPGGADAHAKLSVSYYRSHSDRDTEYTEVYESTVASDAPRPGAVVEALSLSLEEIAGQIISDIGESADSQGEKS